MEMLSEKSQMLRCLVSERLTAAAEEIFALFERTIAEYEEELCRSEDNKLRDRRVRGAPGNRSGVQLKQTKEFEFSTSLYQGDSEIKQEPQEKQMEEKEALGYPPVVVHIDEEAKSVMRPTFTHDTVPSDEDWNKREPPASSSSQNMAVEADGEELVKNPRKKKNYVCGECGKAFGWRATWRRHVATHSDTSPYTCSICSKRFPQKSHLVTHMVTHTGEKPFSCSECNTRFSQKQNLVRHMIIHSGEKSYSCPLCGKRFSHKHSVQLHMLTHTGEKPFSCSLCDSRFTKKPHLNRHMKCCHNREKPYSCPVCQKSFIQRCDVQRHLKIHTRNMETDVNNLDLGRASDSPQNKTHLLSQQSEVSLNPSNLFTHRSILPNQSQEFI